MRWIGGAALAATLLAGCGGGGSSSAVPGRLSASSKQVPVAISIAIPSATSSTSAGKRRPAYVSSASQSAVVNVTPAGAPTTRTVIACLNWHCTGTVPASIGVDTFAISLNDRSDGTGNTLSAGQTTATVVEGQANTVSVTFDGVIASLQVSFDQNNPPVNTTTTITVTVQALDAAGRVIIGPGSYDNPIVLSDLDTSGATTLSSKTIVAPGDPPPTVTYNGAWIGGESASAIISAGVPANTRVSSATAEIIPSPQVVEYTIPTANSQATALTNGPDGALWFTENGARQIGRMTTAGSFTEYPVPGKSSAPYAIASSADGNLYFTDAATFDEAFDQITTAGVVTRHSIKASSFTPRWMFSLVSGPDQNLWAPDSQGNAIARFTPAGVETDFALPTPNANPQAITVGTDGALWFTELGNGTIGKITTAGAITEYPIVLGPGLGYGAPYGITSGPDGALWYVDNVHGNIGRMTTAGAVVEFASNYYINASGTAISTGPDGAIYFTNGVLGKLERVSMKGTLQAFSIPKLQQRGGDFASFAIGSDGSLWYADARANVIGKIVF